MYNLIVDSGVIMSISTPIKENRRLRLNSNFPNPLATFFVPGLKTKVEIRKSKKTKTKKENREKREPYTRFFHTCIDFVSSDSEANQE